MARQYKTVYTQVASAARTTTGNDVQIDVADYAELVAYINVSAVSGTTPTLTVSWNETGNGTDYSQVVASTSITTTGNQRISATPLGQKGRFSWVIGGTTPSFTFSVDLALRARE